MDENETHGKKDNHLVVSFCEQNRKELTINPANSKLSIIVTVHSSHNI